MLTEQAAYERLRAMRAEAARERLAYFAAFCCRVSRFMRIRTRVRAFFGRPQIEVGCAQS